MSTLPPAPGYRKHPLRIGCVQFDPKLMEAEKNVAKIKQLTKDIKPHNLNLLILPEMALTGYMFTSLSEVYSHLESVTISAAAGTSAGQRDNKTQNEKKAGAGAEAGAVERSEPGPSATLFGELARQANCYVIGGYAELGPEVDDGEGNGEGKGKGNAMAGPGPTTLSQAQAGGGPPGYSYSSHTQEQLPPPFHSDSDSATSNNGGTGSNNGATSTSTGTPTETATVSATGKMRGRRKAYNSAMLLNPEGEIIGNYRKSFLFDTDKSWAEEGEGFRYFDLPEPLGRVVIGICMDMNPKDFLAPFNAYELASYVKRVGADLLVVPMNWLEPPAEPPLPASSSPNDDEDHDQVPEGSPDMSTLNYWAHRLTPLHDPAPSYSVEGVVELGGGGRGKEVGFVGCNRVGVERGTKFVGSSSVMTISSSPSGIDLIECLGKEEEGVLMALIN